MSSYSFSTLYVKTNSWLIFELIKPLQMKISVLFNFFFLIIDLYFLIHPVLDQIFDPIAELIIPMGIRSKEAKAEIEINPVTAESKKEIFQCNLECTNLFLLLTH